MNWSLALSAFVFIFLAALPGRTTFLMLLMAARGRASLVFFGAMLAFGVQSITSVALGNLFAFLPPREIQMSDGLLLIYYLVPGGKPTAKAESLASIF